MESRVGIANSISACAGLLFVVRRIRAIGEGVLRRLEAVAIPALVVLVAAEKIEVARAWDEAFSEPAVGLGIGSSIA